MRANRSRAQRGKENGRARADGEIKGWRNGGGKERGRRGRTVESAEPEGQIGGKQIEHITGWDKEMLQGTDGQRPVGSGGNGPARRINIFFRRRG